jgi:cytochrome c oxidase subunit 2
VPRRKSLPFGFKTKRNEQLPAPPIGVTEHHRKQARWSIFFLIFLETRMSSAFRNRLTPWAGPVARLASGLFLTMLALTTPSAHAEYGLTFQAPVTPIAADILGLHNTILIICMGIFVIVFGFMFYSLIVHRKSRGYKPATFNDNTTVEVAWTVVPFVILIAMAIPSTAVLLKMEDTSQADLTLNVTGYQWKWKYEYPDQDLSFFSNLATPREQIGSPRFSKAGASAGTDKGENYLLEVDNPVVLPVGKKIRFVFTANDVIHAWWVPQLGVKKDTIPGFVNEAWAVIDAPGTYRGQCAELCGKDHGFMPIVVEAVAPEDFENWVVAQRAKAKAEAEAAASRTFAKDELMERGQKVYAQACAACHGGNGEGVATFPKLAGSPIATGAAAGHVNIVLNGKPGTAMAAFGPQMNDLDLAAVITYERNAFGNNTGDVVQPAQVKAARKK